MVCGKEQWSSRGRGHACLKFHSCRVTFLQYLADNRWPCRVLLWILLFTYPQWFHPVLKIVRAVKLFYKFMKVEDTFIGGDPHRREFLDRTHPSEVECQLCAYYSKMKLCRKGDIKRDVRGRHDCVRAATICQKSNNSRKVTRLSMSSICPQKVC